METNKRIIIKFLLMVILPVVLAGINNYLVKNRVLDLSYQYLNQSSYILLTLSTLGCLYLGFIHRTKRLFFAFCMLIGIFLILYLLLGYTISNFGF